MLTANTLGADKFFHCMANCQSARRGNLGNLIANAVSEGRESFDENIKGDSPEVCNQDRYANNTGKDGGRNCRPCEDVCSQFRPGGLTYPVFRPPVSYGDCGKFGNWRCK